MKKMRIQIMSFDIFQFKYSCITILAEDVAIKKELINLFYNILDIDNNLPVWRTHLCSGKEFCLYLNIQLGFGIFDFKCWKKDGIINDEADGPSIVIFKSEKNLSWNKVRILNALSKIAIIHLYALGFDEQKILKFQLNAL